jgi:hypothetical protein
MSHTFPARLFNCSLAGLIGIIGPGQAMGFSIAFKSRAKIIDIAINSGYTIFVHKKPLPFPV